MPGYTSMDDYISEVTVNGKQVRIDWNKLTHAVGVQAAGVWYALLHATGNPGAMPLGVNGTNLAWHAAHDRMAGAMYHGGDVLPDFKTLLNGNAYSAAATTMPAVFQLVDVLGWYPVSTVTTTGDQALVNSRTFTATAASPTVITTAAGWDIQEYTAVRLTTTTTLPAGLSLNTTYYWHRLSATTGNLATSMANIDSATYVNASDTGTGTHTITMYLGDRCPSNGAGVQAFITPSTAQNTGVPNIRITYTDAAGNAGNLTPSTLPIANASSPIGQIEYSGTGAGKFGPFMPRAAGDSGIRSVEQFNYSVTRGAGGVANLVLCRPIADFPMTTIGVAAEREFMTQIPSLPRIFDGACLAWLMYAGAATPVASGFFGHLDFGWS